MTKNQEKAGVKALVKAGVKADPKAGVKARVRAGVKAAVKAGVRAFDSIGLVFLSIRSILHPRTVVDRPDCQGNQFK